MPTPLESEISTLLREKEPPLVAEELIRRWRLQILSEEEQLDCAQFLIAAGLYEHLFTEIRHLIRQSAKLPWAQLAEALGRIGYRPSDSEVNALFEAAESQDATPDLLRSRQLDLYSRAFAEKRAALHDSFERKVSDRKQALRDQIQFMRSQRLYEQELKLIEELEALFPAEIDVQEEKNELRLRWAREVVANARATTDPTAELERKLAYLSPEEENVKALLVERAHEIAKEKPELAYDLAIGLNAMGFAREAIAVLEHAASSPAVDWLKLELMIAARQFVTALEEASRLEEVYANDPEATFAATYARARALHGLGDAASAIDLLRGLVRVRPNYKSAQSLLLDWSGGDA